MTKNRGISSLKSHKIALWAARHLVPCDRQMRDVFEAQGTCETGLRSQATTFLATDASMQIPGHLAPHSVLLGAPFCAPGRM